MATAVGILFLYKVKFVSHITVFPPFPATALFQQQRLVQKLDHIYMN